MLGIGVQDLKGLALIGAPAEYIAAEAQGMNKECGLRDGDHEPTVRQDYPVSETAMTVWVCGEVLVDLLPNGAVIGGGPANTARALALLGHDVEFIDGISSDEYGDRAQRELLRDGVKLTHCHHSDNPTCTARVTVDDHGSASYQFGIEDTATFDFHESWLPDPAIHKPSLLHIGSLATIIEPGSSVLHDWAIKVCEYAPIVFDPNIRPSVLSDRERYIDAIEEWVAISTVIKVSDDDLSWLFPDIAPIDVAKRWINEGAVLVVITRGAEGLVGVTEDEVVEAPGVPVKVVDTVGAGDTVGAAIVQAILQHGVANLRGDVLKESLDCAAVAAAITCSRVGAAPPTDSELQVAIESAKERRA